MSKKIPVPPKEELIKLYTREGCTISSLAKHYSTTNPTVRSWLIQYNIERKTQRQASVESNNLHRKRSKPSKEILKKLYQDSTIDSLESYFKVGQQTIYEWLNEYDIEIRDLSESTKLGKQRQYKNIQFSYEELDAAYDRKQPINVLAEKLNISRSHARSQLLKNEIKIEQIDPSWRSKAEIELFEFLVSQFPNDEWSNSDKSIIPPYELDIVNHTKKIAIEYCGLYWHSEYSSGKKQDYHRSKYIKCKDAGYKLVTVFESDNIEKVKSLLLKLLGKTTKIFARKTMVTELTSFDAMKFHNEHHLHSGVGGLKHYGLVHDGDIVMAASFGKNRFSDHYEYECSRITSHSSYTVVGGVSKLISNFIKNDNPNSIVTFSDLRFGDGNVYSKCGFERLSDTSPNYWYTKKYTPILYSRVKFQKHKLKDLLDNYDSGKTEYENMIDNDWDRIWDCGNAKYIWKK